MKKLTKYAAILLCALSVQSASAQSFSEGTSVASVGYGFPNLTKSFFKAYDDYADYKVTGFGPIHLKYEYGLSDKIGFGVSAAYVSTKVSWMQTYSTYNSSNNTTSNVTYEEGFKGTSLVINARMNIHFANGEKIDPYFGFGAGYKSNSFKYFSGNPDVADQKLPTFIPFSFEASIGMRYYFTPNIGAYTEFGFGKSIMQVGISFKF